MVWVIAITCVSLSCEPTPIFRGWFSVERECFESVHLILASWKPEIGLYRFECVTRLVI